MSAIPSSNALSMTEAHCQFGAISENAVSMFLVIGALAGIQLSPLNPRAESLDRQLLAASSARSSLRCTIQLG
jgi:hypothetical protein